MPIRTELAIAMTAWRRPQYLARALRSVRINATGFPLYLSIDHYDDETERQLRDVANNVGGCGHFQVNNPPHGLWLRENAQYHAIEWALQNASAVIVMDDDCILSPDAIRLCWWFLNNHADDYLFLSVGNGNRNTEGYELAVCESTMIDCPWCWCLTKKTWEEKIKPNWQCKSDPPRGWDWSLTYTMWKRRWKSLVPVLPRAKNIGRELAANGGGEEWDKTFKGIEISDGTWGYDYKLVDTTLIWRELPWWREWMREEALREGIAP